MKESLPSSRSSQKPFWAVYWACVSLGYREGGKGKREGEGEGATYLVGTNIMVVVADLEVDAYLCDEMIDEGAYFLGHVLAH